jgi:predicted DsbA family dithiol-disulfide isomerase
MTEADRRSEIRITLYTKPACELCHTAKAMLRTLQDELGFVLDEIDITTDPALYDAHAEEIPVGYLDGRKLFKYRVDALQLRRQLQRRGGWLGGRWPFMRQF